MIGADAVPKKGGEPIKPGEPAARSHTPPGWSVETIAIEPSGIIRSCDEGVERGAVRTV